MRTVALAFALLTLTPALVRAAESVPATSPPQRSPETATLLAVGGTAAGWGLLFAGAGLNSSPAVFAGMAGIAVGPSLGHFYAGERNRGLATMGIRFAGEALMMLGAIGALAGAFCSDDCPKNDWAGPVLLGGAIAVAGATIYDVADAHRAVERQARARTLVVTPAPVVAPSGAMAPGLAVAGTF